MASSLGYYSMLVSLAFLFMFIAPSLGDEESYSKLNKLCSQTFKKSWCMKFMKADSRTADANSRRLTEVAIDLAYNKAQDIYRDLTGGTYSYNTYDPQVRVPCSRNYNDAIRDFERTRKIFSDGDYDRIPDEVNSALEEVRDCKNLFERSNNSNAKELKKMNREFELLCDVVKVSSKNLRHDD